MAMAGIIVLASGAALVANSTLPIPIPRPRPAAAPASFADATEAYGKASSKDAAGKATKDAAKDDSGLTFDAAASLSKSDLDAVKHAIDLVRHGKSQEATEVEHRIEDPLARKVVEWAILRSDDNTADSYRYRDFITANPSWPSLGLFRRRAEAMLWQEHAVLGAVRLVAGDRPLSGKGKFALGRALLERGERASAQAAIRDAWRTEPLPRDAEEQVLQVFGDLISRADEKARMSTKLYANENDTGSRAAQRLGGDEPAVAKMRVAFNQKAANAHELLEALPDSVKDDPLVIFSRIQDLRRADKISEAAALLASASRDPAAILDVDEWWVERRLVARKLLDLDDAKTAYQIVINAATPVKENYRIDREFTAGWISLRFAARYTTAYYGQLARAKLGHADIALAPSPLPPRDKRAALAQIETVRAVDILYAAGERDLVIPVMADLAERSTDVNMLSALAELATHHDDARSVLLVGKSALGRGYAFDRYAFPAFGLPAYKAIAPEVEKAVVYAIARQESAFNNRDVSSANALGLMQVTPQAGQHIAQKFKVRYDQKRLLHDDVYNMQIGAAELYDNISSYNGSFILAFAGYNAGRGRVKEWIDKYGDPRDSGVDPVDWVERIPFAETRNYVQRIIENIQVYRARFGGGSKLQIEADIRRGAGAN
jgi:soluble lytic murein transglycosylase